MLFLRAKHYLATHAHAIIAACVLAVVIGSIIAFTGVATPAIAASPLHESQSSDRVTHTTGVSQSVTVDVIEDTNAYAAGDTLTDRSLYPLGGTAAPVVTATADANEATLTYIAVTVRYEAAPRNDVNDPFYTDENVIIERSPDATEADVEATVPIRDVLAEKQSLENEFGSDVVVQASVTTDVRYEYTPVDGPVVEETVSIGGPIERAGNMYGIPSDSTQTTHTSGTAITETTSVASFVNGASLTAILAGVLGIISGVVAARRIDAKAVSREIQKRRFRDWVTEVESYTPHGPVNVVEVTSLNDLVNLAIDTQRRVLYHSRVNEYIVVEGGTMFKYTPDGEGSSGNTELFGMNPDDLDLGPPPRNFASSPPMSEQANGTFTPTSED